MAEKKKKKNAWAAMASDLGKAAYGAYEALDDQLKKIPGLSAPAYKPAVKKLPPVTGPRKIHKGAGKPASSVAGRKRKAPKKTIRTKVKVTRGRIR
jgi:hypothetical protein